MANLPGPDFNYNRGLRRTEFHDDEFEPGERGELRVMLAERRYEQEHKRRRKERWQAISLAAGVPAAIAALLVIGERLWAMLQYKGR